MHRGWLVAVSTSLASSGQVTPGSVAEEPTTKLAASSLDVAPPIISNRQEKLSGSTAIPLLERLQPLAPNKRITVRVEVLEWRA